MENRLAYSCLVAALMTLTNCTQILQGSEECSKFAYEEYPEEFIDTALVNEAVGFQEYLLDKFEETSVKDENYEAYSLQYYSSHGFGKSIKFQEKPNACYLSIKCYSTEGSYEKCREYEINIDKEDWDVLEEMIYEFDFWTAEAIRPADPGILDGYAYILEGNRPTAMECGKKSFKLVARGSPGYDKMGALCGYILDYEDQLAFRHEKQIERYQKKVLEEN